MLTRPLRLPWALCLLALVGCSPDAEEATVRPIDAGAGASDAESGASPEPPATSSPVASGGVTGGPLEGELEVHVLRASDNTPVPGAHVIVAGQSKLADEAGFVRVRDLEASAVSVFVAANGFVPTHWAGVASSSVTVALALADATVPRTRVDVTVVGLDALAPPAADATFALRIATSLPADLEGLGAALQADASASECRFAPGAASACSIALDVPAWPQRLTGLVFAVSATGELLDPVALAVSPVISPAADAPSTAVTLELLDRNTLAPGILAPIEPPQAASVAVVGVPGLKLADGPVMLFPIAASGAVLLPPLSGMLAGQTYWVITQASYADAQGDSVRLHVLRRGASPKDLRQGEWPTAPSRPSLDGTRLSWAASAGPLREARLRDAAGKTVLEAVVIGASTGIDLNSELAERAASVELRDSTSDFNAAEFSLHDLRAALLSESTRISAL